MKRILDFLVRIFAFIVITPVILIAFTLIGVVMTVVMMVGSIYMMLEFLIYGETKIEKTIKYNSEGEQKDEKSNSVDGVDDSHGDGV